MILVLLIGFFVNMAVVGWAFWMIGDSIKYYSNPTPWIALTIVGVVSIAMLGQVIARTPEDANAAAGHHH